MREKIITNELKHKIACNNKNFNAILSFYLFECPVPDKSYRGNVFEQFGWKGNNYKTLKSKMIKAACDLKGHYYPCKKDELQLKFSELEKTSSEYCVFFKYDERKVIPSLFTAIRNALAHGSFDRRRYHKETFYFFANYYGFYKAKIVLREKTLLKWIDIVKKGA